MNATYYVLIFLLVSLVMFAITWIAYFLNKNILNKIPISFKIVFINIFCSIVFCISIVIYIYNIESTIGYIEVLILITASILYFLIVYFVNYLALKPIKQIEYITFQLANNFYKIDSKKKGNYQFVEIENNLSKIKDNALDKIGKMQKLKKAYGKYVPKQFVKYLGKQELFELTLGDSVQKEVSIMFVDIRNSLLQSQSMSLKDNFGIINAYLGKTSEIVRQNKGFVDKYLGDGILAVFVNPDNALKASVKIIKQLSNNVESINVGVAIHSGKVVIGVVGEKERLSTTIISDSVNLASRLEHFNKIFSTKIIFSKQFLNSLSIKTSIYYRYLGYYELPNSYEKFNIFECFNYKFYKERNKVLEYKNQFEKSIKTIDNGLIKQGLERLNILIKSYPEDAVIKNIYDYINKKNN